MSKEFFRVNRFSACNYTTLGHYNDVNAGTMEHARASLSQGQPRGHPGGQPRGQDVYVVPVWGAPGYDTLTHGTASGTCSGHFNISHAYGANASSCNTRFVERLCTGNLEDIKEGFKHFPRNHETDRLAHRHHLRHDDKFGLTHTHHLKHETGGIKFELAQRDLALVEERQQRPAPRFRGEEYDDEEAEEEEGEEEEGEDDETDRIKFELAHTYHLRH